MKADESDTEMDGADRYLLQARESRCVETMWHAWSSSLLIFMWFKFETSRLRTSLSSTGVDVGFSSSQPSTKFEETICLERTRAQSTTAYMGV